MSGFDNIDNWEATWMIAFQCAIVAVSIFLAGTLMQSAAQGTAIEGNINPILIVVSSALNRVGTLFFFITTFFTATGQFLKG